MDDEILNGIIKDVILDPEMAPYRPSNGPCDLPAQFRVPQGPALAGMIDHTCLKPEAQESDIERLCQEAMEYGFASVCINPVWIPSAGEILKGSPVNICTVIGFPLGANQSSIKRAEASEALKAGARELDMVISVGLLKSRKYQDLFNDIRQVTAEAKASGAITKVIIETCLLTDQEKVRACLIAIAAGCDFLKTSTGFSVAGAKLRDVRLMKLVAGSSVRVKAAGGIRTYGDASEMISAGADRIGASASIKIISSN